MRHTKTKLLLIILTLLLVGGCGYGHPPDIISIGANFSETELNLSGAPTPQTTGYFIMGTWFRNQKKQESQR